MVIKLINRETEGELILEGRFDAVAAEDSLGIFNKMTGRFDTLILNMSRLDYISSAGLRVVKNVHIRMKKKNGELIIKDVCPLVMEVFEVTGMAALLNFEKSNG